MHSSGCHIVDSRLVPLRVFSVTVQYIHCTVTLYCLSMATVDFWHLSLCWISSPALIFIWYISVKQYSLFNKNTDTQSKRCLCTWSFLLWYRSSVFQSHENLMGVYVTFLLWYTVYWLFSQLTPVPQTAGVTSSSLNTHILRHRVWRTVSPQVTCIIS